jgi:tetratricopeptide (TPR) repeat protein
MKNTQPSPAFGAGALLVLLTGMAYLPILGGGFIFDDEVLITQNPMVKAHNGLYRFWFTTEAPDYYPLTGTLYWLEWHLWDGSATGYHMVNVLLHAVNAVLVWIVLRRLGIPAAWLAATVFAIHPVNVATVAWISEQKNTLSMLFYALAILLYLKFDEVGRRRWYVLSLGAFLLALLSKTAVVMLPVVLLGCLGWVHGQLRKRDWLRTAPFFGLSLVFGLATIWLQYHRAMAGQAIQTGGIASRMATAGWAPWFYLSKALVPIALTVIYPKLAMNPSSWISYAPGIVLLGTLGLFWWKRRSWGRPLLFGLGYFVVMLFPVLGFFDQAFYRFSLVADHWQYYSVIGVIALAIAAARWIGTQTRLQNRYLAPSVCMAVLLALGVATWRRCCVYADGERLWRDNVTKNPGAEVAHYNLGVVLQQKGRLSEAIHHFDLALQLKPDSADTHNNLGVTLWHLGRIQEAMEHYRAAMQLNAGFAEAHYNLAIALKQTGKIEEAISQLEQSLKIKPAYAEAHYNLANSLVQIDRIADAINHYETALQLRPDFAEAHYNLGIVLEMSGDVAGAAREWARALQAKPDFAEARHKLGQLRTAP